MVLEISKWTLCYLATRCKGVKKKTTDDVSISVKIFYWTIMTKNV